MTRFYFGLDLGQSQDPTALCVLERVKTKEVVLHGRHLERFPLGTSYPAIVESVAQRVRHPSIAQDYCIIADATGVGRPVVDLLYAAGLRVVPITITGGNSVTSDGEGYSVPKRELVSTLQVLLQKSRLKFAERLPEVSTMIRELMAFKIKVSAAGNDAYGAWREGEHDDLVLACALAGWYAERYSGELILFTA